MSIYIYIYLYLSVCLSVAMSRDVLSVVVSTADWSLCVHINLVMSLDHYIYVYVVMSWGVLSVGGSPQLIDNFVFI